MQVYVCPFNINPKDKDVNLYIKSRGRGCKFIMLLLVTQT